MTALEIARVVHEANRAYCVTMGDRSQVAWEDAPEWQQATAIQGVRGILDGTITRPEQAHESWLLEKMRTGWVYGPVKDVERKQHPCCVPYAALPADQRVKDTLFFAIVRALAE